MIGHFLSSFPRYNCKGSVILVVFDSFLLIMFRCYRFSEIGCIINLLNC